MKHAVCTLFEGSYHLGLAALTNSLHKAGFRGSLYAGYRGALPTWAPPSSNLRSASIGATSVFNVADGLEIVFIALNTEHHLSNYKPWFMSELLDGPAADADALFYFDPDICVVEDWSFFTDWVSCGIALCEDVNSPLPDLHPRRVGWRRFFAQSGVALSHRRSEYINSGFVGVARSEALFLKRWIELTQLMAAATGTLRAAAFSGAADFDSIGFAGCFDRSDQDALNAALETWDGHVSVIGQEAMAFKAGAALMPHAIGVGKPWQRNYLRGALRGNAPRLADKAFWAHVKTPISPYPWLRRIVKRLDLVVASALGLLVRRA